MTLLHHDRRAPQAAGPGAPGDRWKAAGRHPRHGQPRAPSREHEPAPRDPAEAEGDPRSAVSLLHGARINRVLSTFVAAIVVGLIPWILFLGYSLPVRYDARNWNALWIGFDAVLVVLLGYTAWAMWFRRQIVVVTALVTGTLLACDAWFDVMTSLGTKGQWVTLTTALGGEIPLALFFFWVVHRILTRSVAAFHHALGRPGPPPRLRAATLVFAETDPPPSDFVGPRGRMPPWRAAQGRPPCGPTDAPR